MARCVGKIFKRNRVVGEVKLKIEVLVAALNKGYNLHEKMNLCTDAIICNQCEENSVRVINYKNKNIRYFFYKERGVGLNRNNALMRSNSDICTFADDDMIFADDYEEIIKRAFIKLKDADGIIFNIDTIGKKVNRRRNNKVKRIRWYNSLNYGTARLSVRNSSIKKENISFSLLFGGGARYSFGEDTIFIQTMLKRGLKIYVWPQTIASVNQTDSTWFEGYTDKYFYDKGALFCAISNKLFLFYILQDSIRHKKMYKPYSYFKIVKLMLKGASGYKKGKVFGDD